ncbi:hypothetical protein [Komagataeibacter sp. FNDCR2]|uniref:hypothetical protein n=1 Tax=Komagataeibacter sp. FNDCR2 TaxID=2878682 RepID=UPI001E2C2E02|nr:hypothetical protein [Komagataeibacter sp. FNDCR2]MCE2574438.1 hypothetical protein [Komagataeibacter sp. FNDCR2]
MWCVLRRVSGVVGCVVILSACASHPRRMEYDLDPADEAHSFAPQDEGARNHGGNNQIWSDMLRTAMRAGMGMIHR